jgi:hypothetical protein
MGAGMRQELTATPCQQLHKATGVACMKLVLKQWRSQRESCTRQQPICALDSRDHAAFQSLSSSTLYGQGIVQSPYYYAILTWAPRLKGALR